MTIHTRKRLIQKDSKNYGKEQVSELIKLFEKKKKKKNSDLLLCYFVTVLNFSWGLRLRRVIFSCPLSFLIEVKILIFSSSYAMWIQREDKAVYCGYVHQ